ncbi:hypothetical protein GCM10022276_24490 [Sphingomonas limnosediminicola]|jgi:hypothetical protein|uniref:Uncharacterized protein n=1 Tax=Sphingomonas limnosediminicola TaxID=940133 RepID=A0ABP7LPE5_9SPHN
MAHGYLHDEFDRDFGGSDRDRDDRWRERSERDWRGHDRDWQQQDRGSQDRDLGRGDFMFGDRERERGGEHRGFFDRLGDRARETFGGGDRDERRYSSWDRERGEGRRGVSSHPDDHYRSWRDKQVEALDRDYADYCREREQQFHNDFDSWRQKRQGLRVGTGLEQGSGADEQFFTPQTTAVGNTMTTSETHEPQTTTEPEDTVTLGTQLGRRR